MCSRCMWGDPCGFGSRCTTRKHIRNEVDTRDWQWLYTGKTPQVTKETGAKPWKKELNVANLLAKQGFNIEFIKEAKDKKTFDAYLNGLSYEFKVPEKYGEKTVKNQFKKAVGKGTESMVISNVRNGASADAMIRDIEEIMRSDDFTEITNVLFVGIDGELIRFRR